MAYWEQLGANRQAEGSQGETSVLYPRSARRHARAGIEGFLGVGLSIMNRVHPTPSRAILREAVPRARAAGTPARHRYTSRERGGLSPQARAGDRRISVPNGSDGTLRAGVVWLGFAERRFPPFDWQRRQSATVPGRGAHAGPRGIRHGPYRRQKPAGIQRTNGCDLADEVVDRGARSPSRWTRHSVGRGPWPDGASKPAVQPWSSCGRGSRASSFSAGCAVEMCASCVSFPLDSQVFDTPGEASRGGAWRLGQNIEDQKRTEENTGNGGQRQGGSTPLTVGVFYGLLRGV